MEPIKDLRKAINLFYHHNQHFPLILSVTPETRTELLDDRHVRANTSLSNNPADPPRICGLILEVVKETPDKVKYHLHGGKSIHDET